MPPKGHSSSSHRSSSHSSSSSRSGGHRISGGSSGGGHYVGKSRAADPVYPQFTRTRREQPRGYTKDIGGYVTPRGYHCKEHDYIYYGTGWSDHTGTKYKKGYYDENGRYYKTVVMRNTKTNETTYVCPFCGSEVKLFWNGEKKPICPDCGARLNEMTLDEEQKNVFDTFDYTPDEAGYREERFWTIVGTIAALIGGTVVAFVVWLFVQFGVQYYSEQTAAHEPIYVEAIGRTCEWLNEYDSYYDKETDCYFWYNDEIEYPDWQYWYETISNPYGDYGWMEYDYDQAEWYIEVSKDNWVVLPQNVSRDSLWHIAK